MPTGNHTIEAMSLREYLVRMGGIHPENDPAIWRRFLDYQSDFPDLSGLEASPVHVFMGRYAFYLNPMDKERSGMNWALSTPIIDFPLGVSCAEFLKDLPALREMVGGLEKPVITDSFMCADGYPQGAGLIALNSPVAELHSTFERYLESLTSERRKKYRRLIAQYEDKPLRFAFSQDPLTSVEFDFVVKNLQQRWGEDFLYALMQTLWACSVVQSSPQNFYAMRVYDQDRLVFLQSMIARGETLFCQSIVKDESVHYDGIAAYTDFESVRALCGQSALKYFDPSCRTGLDDPESIGVAKRATVNKNRLKPILAAGQDIPQGIRDIMAAGGAVGKEM